MLPGVVHAWRVQLPGGETWELRFGGRQGKNRTTEKFAILEKMHTNMA